MAQHVPTGKPQQQPKQLLQVSFIGANLTEKIMEGDSKSIEFQIANLDDYSDSGSVEVELTSTNPEIATVQQMGKYVLNAPQDFSPNSKWTGSFNLTARFLGYTKVAVKLWGRIAVSTDSDDNSVEKKELLAESEPSRVAVIRRPRAVDRAFIYTVAILVSVAFVNMGCLLDLDVVKETLKKPIGPVIGFCCQYLFMPVCAFGLAKLLLSHNVALQLGLFVTGCSPGGGGSNLWTYILGGNLHLSVTMTFLSTLAAFAMMPLWTMTLGRLVFTGGDIVVPYVKIATLAAGLVVPLMIGLVIRRFLPKVANVLAKMLKPIAGIFVCVIIGFGIYANLYMIQLMDWRVLLSGFSLVMLGYTFGGVTSLLLRQSWPDALTVAIETGVQNTGIAIFILRFTLDQPEADINTVIPVAVAIFTPAPLIFMWVLQKCVLARLGYCVVPVEPNDKVKTVTECVENGKPITNGNGILMGNGKHLPHPDNSTSSVEKLLPNNNKEMVANVKILTED